MSRRRWLWRVLLCLAGLAAIAAVLAFFTLRSQWFYEKVRQRIVSTVETATGGRVEIGSFRFDWRQLRAEVKGFVLHGTEAADKPPLVRAGSVAVGLKIVSALKRDVDIQYLEVTDPRVYLIVHPDDRTNVPQPKIKSQRSATESILKLAIGRFALRNGIFEVESRAATPFDARGRNLKADFVYELAGPRYRGELSIQPLDVQLPGYGTEPFGVAMAVTVEKNRIGVTSARVAAAGSQVEFSGAVDDLAAPHGTFQYTARVSVPEAARILREKSLERGTVEVGGSAAFSQAGGFTLTGNLHAYNVDYRDRFLRLTGFRADAALTGSSHGVELGGLRFSGSYWNGPRRIPVDGRVSEAAVHGRDLDFRGVALAALGGSFHGEARLRNLDRYAVSGEIAGFEARRVVAVYSAEALPWNGRVSGPVKLEGSLKRPGDLRASAQLNVAPEAGGPPVYGQITAAYEARTGTIDLGRSIVTLPSSRADASGVIGRELRVHLETRDLDDLLPALGRRAEALPVKLQNGAAIFDGTVVGKLDDPRIAGRLSVGGFSFEGRSFDSLAAEVTASPSLVQFQNAALSRGSLRAQFQGSLGLDRWNAGDNSAITASGAVRNAPVSELAALLDLKTLPVTGTLTAAGEVSGTLGDPHAAGDIEVVKGALRDEPFDRFTAHVAYSGPAIEVAAGHATAGAKDLRVSGSFEHPPKDFSRGRVRFQAATNAMPLDQVRTLEKTRPGIKGTVQATGSGAIDLVPGAWRVADIHADVNARQLQLTGQSLGDAHLTANSQGDLVRVHLESDFANSVIRGDGEWKLEGDYPGEATVRFSRLDFAQLKDWIAPSKSGASAPVTGSAEGQVHIAGPLLKPELLKAEARLPVFEIGPPPNAAPNNGNSYALKNAGPIVAVLANKVITVENARLTGRATDLAIGGKIALAQKNPLDLRVNGKIDVAVLKDFNPDVTASGMLAADAAITGALDEPHINGRLQVQNAAVNLADFPNGLANANGLIVFSDNRATIQNLSGETGGGKVELSGFATYGGGPVVFRLFARATEVRVRYPEGVSTVADATLNLTGTSERSMLSGQITVLRTSFNPQSDFSAVLAKSAEPVRTPAARTGLLGGLNFDVHIETSPDIQFQSSLTQDIQMEANLQLRGTMANPALLGRINITQGQVVFYGTKFTVSQGSIAFYNPVRVEPVLDIDLETKARGVAVTLTISGTLNKLNLTPRSDPPLEFSEIVALLATGRTPTSDPTLLAQQSSAPQSWQQTGASALLGSAIANPVAGRLQRFFGVTKLRIDPTLSGVENNPQARLTLEQQVTPDITLTYITNVTRSNPQVVRVEWAVSKQWSVVALREENGMFGMDFFFKKRF